MATTKTTAEAVAELEAQGRLEPGEPGYWRVWGAEPRHILPGDLVSSIVDDDVDTFHVQDTYRPSSYPLSVGVVDDGKRYTIGSLARILIHRPGTHHTLAGSLVASYDPEGY